MLGQLPRLAFLCGILATSALTADEPALRHRWVYLQLNLQVPENVTKAESILRSAAAAGYNGVVLADYKLNILDRVPDHYFRHARRFQEVAREYRLEVIPAVAPFGYSDGLLAHNPQLAEGLPVRDTRFIVRNGKAEIARSPNVGLPGGSFEEHRNHLAAGWAFQDEPGKASFIDSQVKHSGTASLRFEDLGRNAAPSGNGRISRVVRVSPWRQFHASVWMKTEAYAAAGNVRLFAMGKNGEVLSHSYLGVQRDQDWTQHHVVFNSLAHDEIRIYCGTWGGTTGKLWMDDVELRESAFINLVRRDGCPLVVRDESETEFKEGTDFQPLRDPKLGMVPYAGSYDVYHEPPVLTPLAGGRIRDGAKLTVSYYHTVVVHDNQVTCCLGDPEVFRILADQVRRVEQLFQPKTYFLSHDEIRLANWCQSCFREDRSAGQLLAENVRQCVATIRQINPDARLCIWSDMFDPHHNARENYYLVQGDLRRSWEGLPQGTTVVNWNHGEAKKSLPFFADRGHTQVLAGFYDSSPASIGDWLATGNAIAGLDGVMYTTWRSDFSQLEAFARHAWGK